MLTAGIVLGVITLLVMNFILYVNAQLPLMKYTNPEYHTVDRGIMQDKNDVILATAGIMVMNISSIIMIALSGLVEKLTFGKVHPHKNILTIILLVILNILWVAAFMWVFFIAAIIKYRRGKITYDYIQTKGKM